jgi:hypothetical protein
MGTSPKKREGHDDQLDSEDEAVEASISKFIKLVTSPLCCSSRFFCHTLCCLSRKAGIKKQANPRLMYIIMQIVAIIFACFYLYESQEDFEDPIYYGHP